MKCDEFDWDGLEPACIVQRSVRKVAVFTNPDDDVAIRQQGHWDDDDDDIFIVIARANVPALIEQLKVAAGIEDKAADHFYIPRRDRTATERQRRHRAKGKGNGQDKAGQSVEAGVPVEEPASLFARQ